MGKRVKTQKICFRLRRQLSDANCDIIALSDELRRTGSLSNVISLSELIEQRARQSNELLYQLRRPLAASNADRQLPLDLPPAA